MNIEIERKFLLKDDSWKKNAVGTHYAQGYLNRPGEITVRVRIAGEKAFLTIKSKTKGISRQEFEYEIPKQDARELLKLSQTPVVEKIRYKIEYAGKCWEIDEFSGKNEGLVVAEIELNAENESFEKPEWIGKEVSDDKRYFNSSLARNPFSEWHLS
ncbi:MAG: CYTH domain-containing protein [Prevotellaceae bacterium]|jgi:adenylate cyclase|nr:CYTH domain-containing protein [Prevotellaceae bacterium]